MGEAYAVYSVGAYESGEKEFSTREEALAEAKKMADAVMEKSGTDAGNPNVEIDKEGGGVSSLEIEEDQGYQAILVQKLPETVEEYLPFIADRLDLAVSEYAYNLYGTEELRNIAHELRSGKFIKEIKQP